MSNKTLSDRDIWSERLARFDAWTPAQKVLSVIILFAIPNQLFYKYAFDALIGSEATFAWVFWFGLGVILFIASVCAYLMWRSSTRKLPYYVMTYLYGAWGLVCALHFGVFDSAYVCFPVMFLLFGFLFDGWSMARHVLGFWVLAAVGVLVARYMGWLPYATAFDADMTVVRASYGWLILNILFVGLILFATGGMLWIVTHSRNHALATVEHTRNLIRRYLPTAVADQIIAGDEHGVDAPQRRRLTILFADIVGFTDIADRVEPEVMTQVLSEYMANMADVIANHGGTLNEFAGDGLMALFGAPTQMEPKAQARQAVAAALAMQKVMARLNQGWRQLGLGAELKTRTGINTGMVSVGSYGSQGRMTYTAVGLQTNIAARIESAAAAGEILISDATYQLIANEVSCAARGEVECKGVHYPIKVYVPERAVQAENSACDGPTA